MERLCQTNFEIASTFKNIIITSCVSGVNFPHHIASNLKFKHTNSKWRKFSFLNFT